ncbi:MAG: YgjP-like metallopeptidase domain-containing protein, partial [Nitrososphaeraceae archaeon]
MNSESWIEVILPNKSVACVRLIRSGRRKKYMCIRVNRSGVCILSPPNEEFESIRDFISDNKAWILKKTKFYTRLNSKLEYGPLQKDEIIYLGKKYKIQFIKDALQ